MEAGAAHLRVFPAAPVRQFVLTLPLPLPLRLLLAARPGLIGPTLCVVHRLLVRHFASRVAARDTRVRTGAVEVIQRFGSAAKLNVHFHCLALDGAHRIGADGQRRFVAAAAPTPARLQALLAAMIERLMRLFVSRGVVAAEPDRIWIEETQAQDGADATDMAPGRRVDGPSALPLLNQASTTYRIATGPQAGRRIARIGGGVCAPGGSGDKPLCAEIASFTLHAATRCRTDDRHRLARLCRYVMRPAFADDQLRWDAGSR
jgi:hypothetical protein